ncbi:MAG: type II toxin-antitoxin system VapC family toxin [Chthoniobacteraceae bacterium]|jgi:predicted nucleic acid-binding protein
MSTVAVDTSVLLAIFKGEPKGEIWFDCLLSAAETSPLVISSVVLAEVRSYFSSDEECVKTVRHLELIHSPLNEESSLLAGKLFRRYRNEGGPRKTILPDFLVAAHAATQADWLASEDRGYLRRYFPAIRLLVPSAKA